MSGRGGQGANWWEDPQIMAKVREQNPGVESEDWFQEGTGGGGGTGRSELEKPRPSVAPRTERTELPPRPKYVPDFEPLGPVPARGRAQQTQQEALGGPGIGVPVEGFDQALANLKAANLELERSMKALRGLSVDNEDEGEEWETEYVPALPLFVSGILDVLGALLDGLVWLWRAGFWGKLVLALAVSWALVAMGVL